MTRAYDIINYCADVVEVHLLQFVTVVFRLLASIDHINGPQ